MLDDFLKEQNIVYRVITNAVKKNKYAHAYLLETKGYSKKEELAIAFAKYLLCPNHYTNNNKCVNCTQCQNINSGTFSEIRIIRPEGLWIKKEQMDMLQKDFIQTGIQSQNRIYIIFEAEKMNASAANSILKFLEEPEQNIIAILVTDNIYQLLDTIISRCQVLSLSKINNIENITEEEKIKILFPLHEELNIDLYKKYVEIVHQFVYNLEQKGQAVLLKTQKLWHTTFNDREKLSLGLDMMLFYYKDILNIKIGRKIEIFDLYKKEILELAQKNNFETLVKKMNLINEAKDNIKINVNNTLLLDKLIIAMNEGEKNE